MKKRIIFGFGIVMVLAAVLSGCFNPLKGGGDSSASVTVGAGQDFYFGTDSYLEGHIEYSITVTNTATHEVIPASSMDTIDGVTSASFKITPGNYRFHVIATLDSTVSPPAGMVNDVYAVGVETRDIKKSEAVKITMKKPVLVEFDNDGGLPKPDDYYAPDGGLVVKPYPNPAKPGYSFVNWFKDAAFTEEWNFLTEKVDHSLSPYTIYSKWIVNPEDGSAKNPFKVKDKADLLKVGTDTDGWTMSAHYVQIADIDMFGEAWEPVGSNYYQAYKGSYDGLGYKISNLNCDITVYGIYNTGLFGSIDAGGAVRNVALVNCSISSNQYSPMGGIAGQSEGTVENCYVTGELSNTASDTGGIIGRNKGKVQNCYTTCSVGGNDNIGGIVGANEGDVLNCYATGDIRGTNNIGGVAGYNKGKVQYCYATGIIGAGTEHAGGIAGINDTGGSIQNCVALTRSISSYYDILARVVGENKQTLSNNYARTDMKVVRWGSVKVAPVPGASLKDGANLTAAQAVTQSWWSAVNWNFSDIWRPATGSVLPTLKNVNPGATVVPAMYVQPVPSGKWAMVSTRGAHTLAIDLADRSLWAWGGGTEGGEAGSSLGNGTLSVHPAEEYPVPVSESGPWKTVSAGDSHVLAIKEDGTLWAWGYGTNGKLGDGRSSIQYSPVQIGGTADWKIACAGSRHSAAIKENGELWVWGQNLNGCLGNGTSSTTETIPVKIDNGPWKAVGLGEYHTIGIKENGTLWGWGNNGNGQLGQGATGGTYNVPTQIGTANDWKAVSVNAGNTFALKTDGSLYGCGTNFTNVMNTPGSSHASLVSVGSGGDSVSMLDSHVVAITTSGAIYTWGSNSYGQLGNGTTNSTPTPTPVPVSGGGTWKSAAAGSNYGFCVGIKSDDTVWAWGYNQTGQLGNGTFTNSSIPVPIKIGP